MARGVTSMHIDAIRGWKGALRLVLIVTLLTAMGTSAGIGVSIAILIATMRVTP
jgi:hypothetical protein